jgi:23S rRNA (uracil1939-C5)-methyltransferase
MAIFELDHYEDFGIEVDFPVSCVVLLADGEAVVLMGNSHIFEHVAGRDYRISAGSFFQVNTAGAEALVALVHDYLVPTGHKTLVDAYCGVGLFGLAFADQVGRLIGIEADPDAVSDFWYNARALDSVEVIEAKAHAALERLGGPVDLMILDPPRSGVGKQVVAEVTRLQPSRVVYVSCDPATLARDARMLTDAGYHLQEVQPLDLFPQTYHIESVALFLK